MLMVLSSRLIFTVIGVSLPVAAPTADMNQTHIYDPQWPPHAKFHNGQTLSMSLRRCGLPVCGRSCVVVRLPRSPVKIAGP
jgi:hypothetical protein